MSFIVSQVPKIQRCDDELVQIQKLSGKFFAELSPTTVPTFMCQQKTIKNDWYNEKGLDFSPIFMK